MKNLTQKQVENIQIDAGIVVINDGLSDARVLAPTRGGGEFTVTNTIRNIEHDGASGAEAGMQVVEKQEAKMKITILDMGQENIALAIPGAIKEADGTLTNGDNGIIPEEAYIKNVTVYSKLLSGKYKKVQICRALHEGALTMKSSPKAEGELGLEFNSHFDPKNSKEKLWRISEVDALVLNEQEV